MKRKSLYSVVLIVLVVILAACSSLNLGALTGGSANNNSSTSSQQGQPGQGGPGLDMSKMTTEEKLAIGLINLEGTDKAITKDQAAALLPLWKAVKTLSSSTTTSTDEMNALYKQIEDALTADQLQAIKGLNLSQSELTALMQKNGIQAQGPQANGTAFPTMSADQRATRQAARSSGTGGNGGFVTSGGPGGGPGGDFGGGPGGAFPGGGQISGTPNAQGTAMPRVNRPTGGMNFIFINPLITILEKRAAA